MLVLHALLYGAPHLQRAFSGTREFNVDLPWPTRALFGLARWWRESSGWMVLTPVCLILLFAIFRASRRATEAKAALLMIVSVLLWGGLLAGLALAVFLPLVRIMEALAR
jgi:type II secretory pathway component PulF